MEETQAFAVDVSKDTKGAIPWPLLYPIIEAFFRILAERCQNKARDLIAAAKTPDVAHVRFLNLRLRQAAKACDCKDAIKSKKTFASLAESVRKRGSRLTQKKATAIMSEARLAA